MEKFLSRLIWPFNINDVNLLSDIRFHSHWALSDSVSDAKKEWKLNIINGTVHTGLSEILSDSYACGKRQIFTKDFAEEWVGYAISLASIAITKESLFGIAITKLSVNGPLGSVHTALSDSDNEKWFAIAIAPCERILKLVLCNRQGSDLILCTESDSARFYSHMKNIVPHTKSLCVMKFTCLFTAHKEELNLRNISNTQITSSGARPDGHWIKNLMLIFLSLSGRCL